MSTSNDRRNFLREKVWSESDIILEKKPENKYFEDIVRNVFDKLDFIDLGRDKLFVIAYDYMKSQGFEERDIGLFLTLFEKGLNVLDIIERKRDELLRIIKVELSEQRKDIVPGERDEELIEQLRREIEIVIKGVRCEVFNLMKDHLAEDIEQAEAEKSSFAGPYIRTLLDFNKGNRRYTDHLKEQLAKLLRTSTQAIAAMKAWKSGELNGRSVTIDDLIEKSRSRISTKSQTVQIPKSQSADVQKTASHKPNEEDLNTTYSFIPDNEYAAIAQSLQPDSFSIDEKKGFTREQRRWIYSLFLLDLGDESGKTELRQHLADKIFKCTRPKVGAITAYLSGNLIAKAEKSKSEVWEDIRLIQEQKEKIDSKKSSSNKKEGNISENWRKNAGNLNIKLGESIEVIAEHSDEKDPDYNNPAKEKGWREPEARMIEKTWGQNNPLRSKKMLLLETPKLLEWRLLEKMGAEEQNLTIVEMDKEKARQMSELLPRANVLHNTLLDHFADIAADRLEVAGEAKKWMEFGVSRDNPGSYIIPDHSSWTQIPINPLIFPDSFNTLSGHAPCSFRQNCVKFPVDSKEKFDLVSLDFTGRFWAQVDFLQLFIKLGLFNHNSVLCTNFLAMREDLPEQNLYRLCVAGHQGDPYSVFMRENTWQDRASSSLTIARDNAISLWLAGKLQKSMGMDGAFGPNNPFTDFYKAFKDDIDQVSPNMTQLIIKKLSNTFTFLNEHIDVKNDVILKAMFGSLMMEAFERRCLEVYGSLDLYKSSLAESHSILGDLLPKDEQYSETHISKLSVAIKLLTARNMLQQAYPFNIGDIIVGDLSDRLLIVSHESYGYFSTSKMNSDFFHIRDFITELGIGRRNLQILKHALFAANSSPIEIALKGKNRRKFQNHLARALELEGRQAKLEQSICRKEV